MKIIRSIILVMIVWACSVTLISCHSEGSGSNTSDTETNQYVPNTDPQPLDDPDDSFSEMLGIYNETEYDQIVVKPVKDVYSLKEDEVFSCTIANQNVGHGFYIYGVVYIDKYVDGEWVRQCNKYATDSQYHLQWNYVGMEGNIDGINSTRDGIAVSDILPEVTPGRYRLVVFTPYNTHYAEFDVQD